MYKLGPAQLTRWEAEMTVRRTSAVVFAVVLAAVIGLPLIGIAVGPPATVIAFSGTPQTTVVNTIFQVRLVAWVRDANTDGVPGVAVTFTAPSSGPSATFNGSLTTTVVTDGSGTASAPVLTANGLAGTYVLTATVAGVAVPAIYNLTNTGGGVPPPPPPTPVTPNNVRILGGLPSTPTTVSPTTGTPQSTTVNGLFAAGLGAIVRDASSSPMMGVTVTFVAPASGATGRFSGLATATAVTDSTGVATSPALTANGVTGGYVVTASVAGVGIPAAFILTNVATPPPSGSGWTSVTPAGMNLNSSIVDNNGSTQDNFGAVGMGGDPAHQGVAYVGGDRQGIWKTTNAGLTWTKVFTPPPGHPYNGSPWSNRVAPDGSYQVNVNGGSGAGGVWRSTDGGVNWTHVLQAGDVNSDVQIDSTNKNNLMAMPHGNGAHWWESANGGLTWSDIGMPSAGDFATGVYVTSTLFIARSPSGLFRMTKSGGVWSSTEVIFNLDGPHGGQNVWTDRTNQYIYVGGLEGTGLTRIWRSSFADGGQNWTIVHTGPGGYGAATIFGTPTHLYAQGNYATHSAYGPFALESTNGTTWTTMSPGTGMNNGAHSAAIVCDGAHYVLLTANTNFGVWRYVTTESCSGGTAQAATGPR